MAASQDSRDPKSTQFGLTTAVSALFVPKLTFTRTLSQRRLNHRRGRMHSSIYKLRQPPGNVIKSRQFEEKDIRFVHIFYPWYKSSYLRGFFMLWQYNLKCIYRPPYGLMGST